MTTRPPDQIPEDDRDYYLERLYPSYGNLAPRDISSRAAKRVVDSGRGVGPVEERRVPRLRCAIARLGYDTVYERYSNLFEMYERITGENPTKVPMRIYPASHYTMGGLWVDYELMTTVPGLYCAGEANFSDHGANRLGASALMQGLADGYFVLPYTIGNYLAPLLNKPSPGIDHPEFRAAEVAARQRFQGYLDIKGTRSPDWFHRELGKIIWDYCGMERTEQGLEKALSELPALYDEFQKDLRVTGDGESMNQTLEKAGRVDDFFQLGMLMCRDALERKESCGGHFRAEYQDEEGEAKRDDEHFAHVAAWEWTGDPMRANPQRRRARVRSRAPRHPELQVSTTTHQSDVEDLAAGRARRRGSLRDLRDRLDQRRGVVPGAARRAQRAADRRGQRADRLRPRLPRRHLRHVLADDRRSGPRPAARHGDLPAAHAQVRRRRTTIVVEPWRATAFPIIKDLLVDRSAFDRIIESRRLHHRPDRWRARCQPDPRSPRWSPTRRWTRPSASAAVRASRPARTARPTCSPRPRSATSTCCPQGQAERYSRVRGDGRDDGAVLRFVHQPRRVRGRLPEEHLHRLHRLDEQGLPARPSSPTARRSAAPD